MPVKTLLRVWRDGEVVSIGFEEEQFLDEHVLPTLRDKLEAIVEERQPSVLRFDLTRVAYITSDVLGILVSLHREGVRVVLHNPSEDVRSIVERTKLDSLMEMVDDDTSETGGQKG